MKPLALVLATIAIIAFATSRPPQLQSRDGASVAEVAQLAERRLRDTSPEAAGSNPALGPLVPSLVPRQLSDKGGVWGTPPPTDAGDVRSGWATFYCCTKGYGRAAVVALPDSRYVRAGREPWGWARVSVLRNGKVTASESFPVVDYCACRDRHGRPTVVDLSVGAAHELGLNTEIGVTPGVWRVVVEVTR